MESGDYPGTLAELEARFSSEEACREYLCQLRWPDGFRCPRCGAVKTWPLHSGRWQCVGCGHQVSATAGTVFQDTRTPLTVWFRAMWLMTSQKNGISALGLQQVLGWGSYQTAWTCLHKLRRTMIRPGRERLPRVHQVISLVKRWLLGTHQGAVRAEHLQDYLDEFTFRFNRRRSRSQGKLFYRLVQQSAALEPTTYKEIVASAHLPASAGYNPLGIPKSDG